MELAQPFGDSFIRTVANIVNNFGLFNCRNYCHCLFRLQNFTAMADKLNDLAGRMGKAPKGLGLGAKLVAVGVGAYVGLQQSMYTVDGGHRAIMFNRIGGIQDYSLTEGLHFRLPWFQYPIIYDIRARPRKITSPTGSKDLQMVNISLRVLSRPDSMNLPALHKELGQDFDEKVGKRELSIR